MNKETIIAEITANAAAMINNEAKPTGDGLEAIENLLDKAKNIHAFGKRLQAVINEVLDKYDIDIDDEANSELLSDINTLVPQLVKKHLGV